MYPSNQENYTARRRFDIDDWAPRFECELPPDVCAEFLRHLPRRRRVYSRVSRSRSCTHWPHTSAQAHRRRDWNNNRRQSVRMQTGQN
jgi:hypothetical protein